MRTDVAAVSLVSLYVTMPRFKSISDASTRATPKGAMMTTKLKTASTPVYARPRTLPVPRDAKRGRPRPA